MEDSGHMFCCCTNLEYLALPNQMIYLRDAYGMFDSCSSLKSIDLSFLENNTKIYSFSQMFLDCKNLIEIEFPNVYTNYSLNLEYMFHGCTNIKRINLRKMRATHIGGMTHMFSNCEKLEFIDISGLNLTNVNGYEKFN
ncbi:MAG: leucine-rich repeat protein, partial [Elusimicrobia bacterium]|nr:leucine-rich repeat protein [Elusimicrobiota bacterium]